MSVRNAKAVWNGTLSDGKGEMSFGDYTGPYTFASRFTEGDGTNPEELVGAAIAGCYSMFLSALLSSDGLAAKSINTKATVTLGKDDVGPNITDINLDCKVNCDGLTQGDLDRFAKLAKENCPISRLYHGGTAKVELTASLDLVEN
jgi:osmotically inducible protein OsmC